MPLDGEPFNPYKLFFGIFIPECIVWYPYLSPGAKLCYGRLARYAGEKGKCFPSQYELAGELGVSQRNVRRYLEELRSKEFIRITRRGLQRSNVYEFLWHDTFHGHTRNFSVKKTNSSTPVDSVGQDVMDDPDGSDPADPDGLHLADPEWQDSPDPSLEESLEESQC